MRILLDECLNPRLRLAKQASLHFDVFVTLDRNLQFQNPTGKYLFGIVVLVTRLNHLVAYRPQFPQIRDAVRQVKPGQTIVVEIR